MTFEKQIAIAWLLIFRTTVFVKKLVERHKKNTTIMMFVQPKKA
jgi:hypothetical protein